jgi:hypothetical protein
MPGIDELKLRNWYGRPQGSTRRSASRPSSVRVSGIPKCIVRYLSMAEAIFISPRPASSTFCRSMIAE